jgi:Transposase DDE domain group 1
MANRLWRLGSPARRTAYVEKARRRLAAGSARHSDAAIVLAAGNTIRLRLLKLGARVIEMASRVRLAFSAACPDATLIRHIVAALMPTGP